MPQPLADIGERIELLKMTLGLFAPSEPAPVAVELVTLGEEMLEHALIAAGVPLPAPVDGERLLALLSRCQSVDPAFAGLDPACRTLLEQGGAVVESPDSPESGTRLASAAASAGDLYSFVAARVNRAT